MISQNHIHLNKKIYRIYSHLGTYTINEKTQFFLRHLPDSGPLHIPPPDYENTLSTLPVALVFFKCFLSSFLTVTVPGHCTPGHCSLTRCFTVVKPSVFTTGPVHSFNKLISFFSNARYCIYYFSTTPTSSIGQLFRAHNHHHYPILNSNLHIDWHKCQWT